MTAWLVDTFVYTALLIAVVLLLRRPTARHFGPQVAYALWALPLMRFVMPPLVLPAWMAPGERGAVSADPLMVIIADAPAADLTRGAGVLDLLLPLWLGGAALFLAWRARNYVAMRRELLADARPVGRAGPVRLVETPAVTSPVAFGVMDKVVALPPAFMAHPDRTARDMAIAHELAHHTGHDLLANIAAQPVLGLHWFNPLAWAGWRAMRRDQEAACDARVIAGRGRCDRAAYAQVIAEFAAGEQRLALAAPMACPMLGEKSIIQRLRNLTMDEVSCKKRRAGLASVSLAALALPFTASISYAAPETRSAPRTPAAPHAASASPTPAAAPVPAPLPVSTTAETALPAEPSMPFESPAVAASEVHVERVTRRIAREEVRRVSEMDEGFEEMERELEHLDEEIETAVAQADRALAEARPAIATTTRAAAHRMRVEMSCEGDEPVIERDLGDGRTAILICNRAIHAQAVHGLREARREIARETDMPREQRERVIRQLDRQIDQLSARAVSYGSDYRTQLSPVTIVRTVASEAASETCLPGEIV